MPTFPRLSIFAAASLLSASAGLGAQTTPVTSATQASVINSVIDRLASGYVDADTGRLIGEHLRSRLQANAYASFTNPAQFADVVSNDLRSVNGDLHLGLRYVPETPSAPGGGGGPGDPRSINFGIGRVEILDGNIGYLEITGFAGGPGYQEVVGDAMRLLARADALIVDVRRNGGGSSEMSHLVFSHFLPATTVATIRVQRRGAEAVLRNSIAEVPGPRRTDVPLYVLTSQGTASAAEEFSFVLRNQRRATIVGSRTAGAGHMVNSAPVGSGFVVSFSITRVTDAESKREWERVGVLPNVDVPPEQALDAAYAAALRTVRAKVQDSTRSQQFGRLISLADVRRNPITVDAKRLASYVGNYEGRVVSLMNGQLMYARREGSLREALVPLAPNRFALGATRLVFDDSTAGIWLTIQQANGTEVTLKRAP